MLNWFIWVRHEQGMLFFVTSRTWRLYVSFCRFGSLVCFQIPFCHAALLFIHQETFICLVLIWAFLKDHRSVTYVCHSLLLYQQNTKGNNNNNNSSTSMCSSSLAAFQADLNSLIWCYKQPREYGINRVAYKWLGLFVCLFCKHKRRIRIAPSSC
jgi:hypothetical protein